MPRYLVRKRRGWCGRIRVTIQEVDNPLGNGPERWRATFHFYHHADDFIRALCANSKLFVPADGDYDKTDLVHIHYHRTIKAPRP